VSVVCACVFLNSWWWASDARNT